jgi:hypothetical protein
MALLAFNPFRRHPDGDPFRKEAEKVRVAAAQLDCADLYLAAAVNLEIQDREISWMLDDLRRRALWVRDQLAQPAVIEG